MLLISKSRRLISNQIALNWPPFEYGELHTHTHAQSLFYDFGHIKKNMQWVVCIGHEQIAR